MAEEPILGIIEAPALSEDEARRVRDAFAAAQGRPASWYPIAPYEVRIVRPHRSWWRRLLNLPARAARHG
ncbi:hypothetical protein E1258_09595 [Micromonospora sp. KC207]|uniref:hypothetical protein n=1 Tax=Micromonospora sp. KC207 TaxID=2530377 RepID=UPI0010496FC4|nr:hypothetical protein [Micromonospora sp. KC207]TDC63889.1 hypothetical protein E1258_09595 [Micromonospora sp. KC207]